MNLPKSKLKYILLSSIFVLSFFLFYLKEAQAVNVVPITAAPARQEILVEPGERTAINIKFLNQGDVPVSGTLHVVNFIVESKDGSPTFIENPTQISPRFAAASWVKLPYQRITIAAKDKVQIQAQLSIPEDVQPGGKYFAIYFEPTGRSQEALGTIKEGVTPTTFRIAGLVYLKVAGPVEENAYLSQLKAPRFLEYGPIPVSTEILNKGNYHIKPKGIIILKSIFGKKIDEQLLEETNIFPDISRTFENKLGTKWMFGRYRLELSASYGETGQILTATVFTWVFPWKLATAIILGIVIIILLISLIHKKMTKKEEQLEEKVEELEEELAEISASER